MHLYSDKPSRYYHPACGSNIMMFKTAVGDLALRLLCASDFEAMSVSYTQMSKGSVMLSESMFLVGVILHETDFEKENGLIEVFLSNAGKIKEITPTCILGQA